MLDLPPPCAHHGLLSLSTCSLAAHLGLPLPDVQRLAEAHPAMGTLCLLVADVPAVPLLQQVWCYLRCLLGWEPGEDVLPCPCLLQACPGSWSSSQLDGTKHSGSLWAAPPVPSAGPSLGKTTQGRMLRQAPSLAVQLLLPWSPAGPWLGRSSRKERGGGGCHRSSRKAPK